MKGTIWGKGRIFALVLLVFLIQSIAAHGKTDEPKTLEGIVQANTAFALKLYRNVSKKKGNLFFSPFSISDALAMTYAGARGDTERQMEDVLGFFRPQERFHAAFSALIEKIFPKGPKKDYTLRLANAMWGQKGYGFLPKFINAIDRYYHGGFFPVDFVSKTEETRQKINLWVEKHTEKKIRNLIQKGDINPLTRLVLTNAIYFKGFWASQFKVKNTKSAAFHLEDGRSVSAPMMFQSGEFPYFESRNGKLQVVELPYAGKAISMIIFLPSREEGLTRLEQSLSVKGVHTMTSSLRTRNVDVYLPRFRLNTKLYLSRILARMGMSDAFSEEADLSGMTGNKELQVSKVIHQAYVDVDEKGTEAAAATAVVIRLKAMMSKPVFRANHPFLFMIIHKKTGSILFMGRVENPLVK